MILKLLTFSFLLISSFSFGQQWEQRASTPFTKDHGIGFSLDGFGYVLTGGANGQVFSATRDFFKYDPVLDTWEQLPDYPGPNRGYGIGDVWNGKVYFGFGYDGFTLHNDLWSWDPVDGFVSLPDCPCAGRVHPALIAVDDKVYVGAGGGGGGNLGDWWEYDIVTQVWSQKTNLPGNRHHPYQFTINGDIYVGNGHLTSWYKFTPSTNSWTQIASLGARVAGAQFSYNGKGYALSGGDVNHTSFSSGQFQEYDPIADTWTALPNPPDISRFGPTQFVIDNYVYLAGGYERNDFINQMDPLSTMFRYQLGPDPSSASVEESDNELSFKIYPNPASNEINILTGKDLSNSAVINVYSLSGQLMMTTQFSQTIDISNLTNGMYILDVVDEEGTVFKQKISKI